MLGFLRGTDQLLWFIFSEYSSLYSRCFTGGAQDIQSARYLLLIWPGESFLSAGRKPLVAFLHIPVKHFMKKTALQPVLKCPFTGDRAGVFKARADCRD